MTNDMMHFTIEYLKERMAAAGVVVPKSANTVTFLIRRLLRVRLKRGSFMSVKIADGHVLIELMGDKPEFFSTGSISRMEYECEVIYE